MSLGVCALNGKGYALPFIPDLDATGFIENIHSSCRSVLGVSLGTTRKLRPHLLQETAKEVFPLLANNQLKIKIGHEYPLEEAAEAHNLMENRLNKGKIILNVDSNN
ncbi:zinc-binding dehydrogenase [Bacillus yapensis]|uniref:zinc-binding dehydrogenase n=1 Tax=Bacillus yapensis TaxID=2492960 RepID=UPI001FE24BAA|nr:zinc-binding dehydrogenase [Bacillus yapensis]